MSKRRATVNEVKRALRAAGLVPSKNGQPGYSVWRDEYRGIKAQGALVEDHAAYERQIAAALDAAGIYYWIETNPYHAGIWC